MTLTVNVSSLRRIEDGMRQRARRVINSERVLGEIASIVLRDIRGQSRSGRDPSTGERYRPLANSTIAQRRRLARNNRTGTAYSNRRPNLTLSGSLINSLASDIQASSARVTIQARGLHPGYRLGNGNRTARISNQRLLEIHQRGEGVPARRILGIRPTIATRARALILRELRRSLARR